MQTRSVAILLALLVAGGLTTGARAAIPADHQAQLLLRVLAYDHLLVERARGEVTVAVLARANHAESETWGGALFAALSILDHQMSVAGLPIRVVAISAPDVAIAEAALERHRVAAVYICPGWSDQTAALAQATRRLSALSFVGSDPKARDGPSIGLVQRGNRPVIVVNLPAVVAEGARLDAGLLTVAEVRR